MIDSPAQSAPHPTMTVDLEDEAVSEAFRQSGRGAIDFRYLAAALRSNMWLIAGIIAAALALAVAATLLDTPRYTATAAIQINDAGDRVISDKDDTTRVNESYDVDRFLKTQTDVLKSRGLAQRVAQRLKLESGAAFFKAMEVEAARPQSNREATRNLVLGLLTANLKVNLPRDSRIVTVSFNAADPVIAAQVANAFVEEFIQSNLQRKFDSTAYARGFVAQQMGEAKAKLEATERELNDYARAAGLIRTRDAAGDEGDNRTRGGGSVTTSNLLQMNAAANDARAVRFAAEARWRAVSSGPPLASREVLSNSAVNSLLTQRAQLEAALQDDLTRHLDDYPTVKQKRAELAKLNSELNATAAAVRASIRAEYLAAQSAETQLVAQVARLKGETMAEQDRSVRFALLEREADTSRTLYDGLLARYNELNATAGISASNVSVIDTAEAPLTPTSPSLVRNLLLALLAGVGLAGLTLFLKDQLDDAIRVPEDVEHKLRLPLLGVVPTSQARDPESDLLDPKSPVSEAYNSLRGALLYSTTAGLPQVMLVTSAQPSEGKTTTSFAIAAGLARMGRKTVLVDADLRRPSVHKRAGGDNARGLTTLLTTTDAANSAILPSGQPGFDLLPSGPVPPSPTELLSSTRMEQLLLELAKTYDAVVIDSPPILGLADSPMLSALVDGVIFVVESDRGRRGSLKTALRRLRAMRPVLLGAVLTKFDPTRAGNRYSEYYGYQYYQYEKDDAAKA